MNGRMISYTHDGDTFVGRYRVSHGRGSPSVSVEYERAIVSASVGAEPEERVARSLLAQLVREKLIPSHAVAN
jgi:hypothetical protein